MFLGTGIYEKGFRIYMGLKIAICIGATELRLDFQISAVSMKILLTSPNVGAQKLSRPQLSSTLFSGRGLALFFQFKL